MATSPLQHPDDGDVSRYEEAIIRIFEGAKDGRGYLAAGSDRIRHGGKSELAELSDDGHIENLVMYELLQRRCKFIICVDGESDPTLTFQGPRTLIRHAQIVPFP